MIYIWQTKFQLPSLYEPYDEYGKRKRKCLKLFDQVLLSTVFLSVAFFFSFLTKPVGQAIVQWQRKTYSLDMDLGIPASSSHSFITFSIQAIPWGYNFDQQSKRYRTASEKKGQMLLLYMKLKFCWLHSQLILYN